jgi:hypothetical protein
LFRDSRLPSHPHLAPQNLGSRPYLVPPLPRRHTPLALWHLLSLDAPSVAALWTWFIAHSLGLALPWQAIAAMFTAVWMIYAADRLLDARLLDARQLDIELSSRDLEERHRFHHRHRSRFLSIIVLASLALAALLLNIHHRALELYMLLATLLGTWLLLIHARPQPHSGARRLPKELAVGLFFPAAIFIPTVARVPQLQLQLLPIAALFAAACTLNCLFLYAWEHPPQPHSQPNAHWTTLWAIRHLPQLSLGLLALCVAVILRTPIAVTPAIACAISIALLLLLHLQRRRITPLHLRATADLVLLSPLLFLFCR